ncbi:DUF2199 domain-containing protein [Shewanella baltica]|uniref:DUF2199 domain-containing protein n=1 Tax=Shewanella baltica TaxID=62322 RepID=UPI00015881A6|nr:hypothetical protein Shew185_2415 [Shewanella baltica OS185]
MTFNLCKNTLGKCDLGVVGYVSHHGWLGNWPFYTNTYALKIYVNPRDNNQRPLLTLHESEHDLVCDFVNGISIFRAQEIAEQCMHN